MRRIKILIIIMLLVIALGMINTLNGAVAIKESGTNVLTNQTISNFYDMSLQMKNVGQGLEGTQDNVEPHLVTNTEWAIVSYFSNSNYGTSGEGVKSITINGNVHNSTNGNATGVMDWGRNITMTAGYIGENLSKDKYKEDEYKENGKSLFAEGAKYVENISISEFRNEKYANKTGNQFVSPYIHRRGLFEMGTDSHDDYDLGRPSAKATFRPTIWN